MLCLSAAGHLPQQLTVDIPQRRRLADLCRTMLIAEVGSEAGDPEEEYFPYLDAERDATIIIRFLLETFDIQLRNYTVTVHDRFGNAGPDPERGILHIQLHDRFSRPVVSNISWNLHPRLGRWSNFDYFSKVLKKPPSFGMKDRGWYVITSHRPNSPAHSGLLCGNFRAWVGDAGFSRITGSRKSVGIIPGINWRDH